MEKYLDLFKEGMNKDEFATIIDKVSQASSDKVRTEYSTKIKELESKIPTQKSQQEIELEEKLKTITQKEQELKLVETLQNSQLPTGLAKYLKGDNLENLGSELGTIINDLILNNGFKPNTHKKTETTVTKEQFKKFNYQQRVEFSEKYPDLYKQYITD